MSEGASSGKAWFPVWRTPDGKSASCVKEIKVFQENLDGIRALAKEESQDAVLMDCDARQFRLIPRDRAEVVGNSYKTPGT